ncbi:ATP-binding protein, partial [Streptomyces sp. MT29]|nr:ATP-binding protein [Streptomyces sp. MT29]
MVGAPGVGKTALAKHWAHARREHFADGQLFVDLRGHSPLPALRPGDVLAQFLRALGATPGRCPPTRTRPRRGYRTLLADRQMLIVLDNARDAEQVRPLIPGARGCAVVITSRSRLAGLVASDGARQLALDVLDPDEARRLLGSIVVSAGHGRGGGGPPARTALRRPAAGHPDRRRQSGGPRHGHRRLLRRTGGRRPAQPAARRRGPALDRARRLRPLLPRAPGRARRMFRLLGLMPGPDVSVNGAAALADTTSAAAAELLVTLTDAHLVRERAAGRFGLHDLVHSYARELAGPEEAHAARQRLFEWYLYHADAAARLLYPVEPAQGPCAGAAPSAALVFSDHGEASEWLDSERENLSGAVPQAADAGFTTLAWRLAESLHGFLSVGMYTGEYLKAATAGLFAAAADGEPRAQAAAQLRRAECHWLLADRARALELLGSALELARQAGWADGQAQALRRIGAAHRE